MDCRKTTDWIISSVKQPRTTTIMGDEELKKTKRMLNAAPRGLTEESERVTDRQMCDLHSVWIKVFHVSLLWEKGWKNYSPWINSMSGKLDNNSVLWVVASKSLFPKQVLEKGGLILSSEPSYIWANVVYTAYVFEIWNTFIPCAECDFYLETCLLTLTHCS